MLLFNVFMHTPHSCSHYNITCNNTEFLKIAVKIFDSMLIKGISEKPVHVYVSVGAKAEQWNLPTWLTKEWAYSGLMS